MKNNVGKAGNTNNTEKAGNKKKIILGKTGIYYLTSNLELDLVVVYLNTCIKV